MIKAVEYQDVFFSEKGFDVKTCFDEKEKLMAYKLRYKIFSETLKWVSTNKEKKEIDLYDRNAIFFGVFKNKKIISFLRLLTSSNKFMLENEFSMLISQHDLVKQDNCAEISRLCIMPKSLTKEVFNDSNNSLIGKLLYKGLYQWCLKNRIRYIYFVSESKIMRLFRISGFPCKTIGSLKIMPDGTQAVAAIMDWYKFETLNNTRNPEMTAWFNNIQ